MFSVYIYPICLIMFLLCLGAVMMLERRGVSHNKILITAGILGVITVFMQLYPPGWYLLGDYTKAYAPAGRAAAFGDQAAMTEVMALGVEGFVNLPIVAFLFAPFGVLPTKAGDLLFLGVGGLAGLVLWRELVIALDLKTRANALFLFLIICAGPMAGNLYMGNTTQFVMLLVVWAMIAMMQRRDISAGALFAMAALMKPALIIFGVYAVLRGRWTIAISGGAVCVTATLLSILIFGWSMHMLWLEQTILPALDGTILAHNIQSIGGVVGRAIVGGEYLLNWNPQPVPEIASIVTRILQLATIAAVITSITFLARRNRPDETAPLEVSLVLMIPLLIPNLSWNHYLIWAFLPLALCLRDLPALKAATGMQIAALVAAALIAQPVEIWPDLVPWLRELFARLIVSLPFVGAIILLVLMVRMTLAIRTGESEIGLVKPNARTTVFSPPIKVPFLH